MLPLLFKKMILISIYRICIISWVVTQEYLLIFAYSNRWFAYMQRVTSLSTSVGVVSKVVESEADIMSFGDKMEILVRLPTR